MGATVSDHDDDVDPKGPLRIPVAVGLNDGASHHSPGFDEREAAPPNAETYDATVPLTVEVPPSAPDEVPRASLSELMTGASAGEETS